MEFSLFEPQYDMLTCKDKTALFVGGIGSGKTMTLAHCALEFARAYPKTKGLIVANTYSQLETATIPKLTNLLDDLGIRYKLVMGGSNKRITFLGITCLIYSLDVPENIRGIEVGWILADEIPFSTRKAFDIISGRLRCKHGPLYMRMFGSPNGFNWLYDLVNTTKVSVFKMRTKDNTFLPEEYITNLVELYGGEQSALSRQELFGEFVNQTSKQVYYGFNRSKHIKLTPEDKNKVVYVCCDFNAGNMNYVVFQWDQTGFKVIKSVTLKDFYANTFSMANEIFSTYGQRALIIPDSTANARKASAEAGITDIKILENVGLKVLPTINPRIKDRQNTVNLQFMRGRIQIDPFCIDLIKELETLGNDEDEGKVSHLAVALGYGICKLDPLLQPQKQASQTQSPFGRRG